MKLRNQQIKDILENYSIGEFKSKTLARDGWNTAYRIKTTKGNFILKILGFPDEKELIKEIEITNRLKDKIPCSFPLQSKNGKFYIDYEKSFVLIKKFIKGKSVLRGEKLSDKNLAQLGKYYAIIHKEKNLSNIPKKDLYLHLQKFFNKISKESPEFRLAKSTFTLLERRKFKPSILPKGLIHADLHTENLLVNNGKIVAILDFEDSHIGSFIYDLGYCVLDTCWKSRGLSKKRITLFLKGYKSIRKLTEQEREHLIDATLLAGLYSLHFHIIKEGLNKNNLDRYFVKRLLRLLKDLPRTYSATQLEAPTSSKKISFN